MKEHGISLIIADSMEEINSIRLALGVGEVSALKSFEQMIFIDPNAVFYAVFRSKREMEQLAQYFTVKRGVISYNGHRELIGFNVDWVKKLLTAPKERVLDSVPVGIPMEEERESPFESLGYR